jgi:hypothetical protein
VEIDMASLEDELKALGDQRFSIHAIARQPEPTEYVQKLLELTIEDDCRFMSPLIGDGNPFESAFDPGDTLADFTRAKMYVNMNIAFIKSIRNCLCGWNVAGKPVTADMKVPVVNFQSLYMFLISELDALLPAAQAEVGNNLREDFVVKDAGGKVTEIMPLSAMGKFARHGEEMTYSQLSDMVYAFIGCLGRGNYTNPPSMIPEV